MRLSLVIPCYNEARSLPGLVARCIALTASGDVEVVLIDNGSGDDTPVVMAALLEDAPGVRSVRVDVNQGYGFGILAGLAAARGDILGWTHADLQTDPLDARRGMELFDGAAQPQRLYVKGRRHGRPPADVIFTQGMSLFETALLGRPLIDINAQPNLFPRAFYETWRDPPHDFSLDLYVYHAAKAQGLTVERFPVTFGDRQFGESHWNVDWRSKAKFIRRTLDFSLQLRRDLQGRRP